MSAVGGSIHDERPDYFVQSLERGLAVIAAFTCARPGLTLSEVAESTGLTRAAARRFLLTLTDLGFVEASGRSFSLTPKVLELGYAYLASSSLAEVVQPHITCLITQAQELRANWLLDAGVAILDGDDIVYIAQARVARILLIGISTGARFPAYVTSMGRVILGALSEPELTDYLARIKPSHLTRRTLTKPAAIRKEIEKARRQGWSVVDREYDDLLRTLAVPIHDADGAVIAALSVSTHASTDDLENLVRYALPLISDTASKIERQLKIGPAFPTVIKAAR